MARLAAVPVFVLLLSCGGPGLQPFSRYTLVLTSYMEWEQDRPVQVQLRFLAPSGEEAPCDALPGGTTATLGDVPMELEPGGKGPLGLGGCSVPFASVDVPKERFLDGAPGDAVLDLSDGDAHIRLVITNYFSAHAPAAPSTPVLARRGAPLRLRWEPVTDLHGALIANTIDSGGQVGSISFDREGDEVVGDIPHEMALGTAELSFEGKVRMPTRCEGVERCVPAEWWVRSVLSIQVVE